MASFLTIKASQSSYVSSVNELVSKDLSACIDASWNVGISATRRLYPSLALKHVQDQNRMPSMLESGDCDAIITDQNQYAIWKRSQSSCHLMRIDASIMSLQAGWLTTLNGHCEASALNYGLQYEIDSGFVASAYSTRMAPASCAGVRRGMATDRSTALTTSTGGGLRASINSGPSMRRTASGHTAVDDTDSSQNHRLSITDMSGLFMVYGFTVLVVLLIKSLRQHLCPAFSEGSDEAQGSMYGDVKFLRASHVEMKQEIADLAALVRTQKECMEKLGSQLSSMALEAQQTIPGSPPPQRVDRPTPTTMTWTPRSFQQCAQVRIGKSLDPEPGSSPEMTGLAISK